MPSGPASRSEKPPAPSVAGSMVSTPLRGIGPGSSSDLGAQFLEDPAAGFPLPDPLTGALGLIGLQLNPNIGQGETFTVVDNTESRLVTDAADGDMTGAASSGDDYIGVYRFDNVWCGAGQGAFFLSFRPERR